MKYYYCTLFDSHYLTRGIAMLESLRKHCKNYHLFILAFDAITYEVLTNLNDPHITLIALQDFEDEALLLAKKTRTKGEYCWTCTPSLILYCISNFNLPLCTYLDADLYFFDNPNPLIDEMQPHSILITSHNYTPRYNQEKTSGIYCVQFLTFKSTPIGLEALKWWRDRCLQWCYARFEEGKFGDQKYLDDWPSRFKDVHILSNPRGGLAPWNIQQFSHIEPIFYHFHHLQFIGENKVDLSPYFLPKITIQKIYTPYIRHLLKLRKQFLPHNFDARCIPKISWKTPLRFIKRKILRTDHIFKIEDFGEHHGTMA